MDKVTNIDNNVVKIGKTQNEKFKELSIRFDLIEANQKSLQQNMIWLGDKLDTIISMLQESSDK